MQVKASVTAIQQHETALGDRLYTVFQTADGRELGIWTSDPVTAGLRVGDQVLFDQDARGCLKLNRRSLRRPRP